jgi:hypothetical protein
MRIKFEKAEFKNPYAVNSDKAVWARFSCPDEKGEGRYFDLVIDYDEEEFETTATLFEFGSAEEQEAGDFIRLYAFNGGNLSIRWLAEYFKKIFRERKDAPLRYAGEVEDDVIQRLGFLPA